MCLSVRASLGTCLKTRNLELDGSLSARSRATCAAVQATEAAATPLLQRPGRGATLLVVVLVNSVSDSVQPAHVL